jgi:hypothetical protein
MRGNKNWETSRHPQDVQSAEAESLASIFGVGHRSLVHSRSQKDFTLVRQQDNQIAFRIKLVPNPDSPQENYSSLTLFVRYTRGKVVH